MIGLTHLVPMLLLAQAGEATGGGMPPWMHMLILALLIAVPYYFLIGRPMREQRRRVDLIKGIKKNDRIVTEAGIYGTVVSVDPNSDKMVLRVDDDKGIKLTCTRSSVLRVLDSPTVDKE